MSLNVQLIASEVMMSALKRVPVVGDALDVVKSIADRHEAVARAQQVDRIEETLTRIELRQRDLIADEIRATLANLARPGLAATMLTEEIRNLRQIQQEGWQPNLFEGLLRNSSHLEELKRAPENYGRLLGDHDLLDPSRGAIHLLIDADRPRILELPPFAFAQLLANQAEGVPIAQLALTRDVWAFPSSSATNSATNSEIITPSHREPERAPTPRIVVPAKPPAKIATSKIVPLKTVTSKIGSKFVLIPPGEFDMGSDDSDDMAYADEKPKHRVRISRPFYLQQTPVTQREFAQFKADHKNYFPNKPDHPAESVTWDEAVQFCNWLSEKEKIEPYYYADPVGSIIDREAPGYRLPTEAESEYACRGGKTTRYWFGDEVKQLVNHAWFGNNSGKRPINAQALWEQDESKYFERLLANGCSTQPVGKKPLNPFQLADMHGNVWEWMQDFWDAEAYKSRISVSVDPLVEKPAEQRALRGGSWNIYATNLRAACRNWSSPSFRSSICGFRPARTYL